jgi:hypothetical protein
MSREMVIVCVEIASIILAIAAFVFLPDPQGVLVAGFGILVAALCHFLNNMSGEPAVGTNDAPQASPTKDYTGGSDI